MENDDISFCGKMRKATRDIHAISDALVNAKLAFGFQDDQVWADGLLVFYEIFRYLEGAMDRLKTTKIGLLNLDGLKRAEAFERDLDFYLGRNWMKNYQPRESVAKYLMHLREIEDTDSILLLAYIYHLYMGLLSGGQILRKKRQITQKIPSFSKKFPPKNSGNEITNFGEKKIRDLKNELKEKINEISENLDDEIKDKLLEESKIVYRLNNDIIRSVRGAGIVVAKKICYFVVILGIIGFIVISIFSK